MQHINTFIFDLDNTLYNAEEYIFNQLRIKETEFLKQIFNLPYEELKNIKRQYVEKYGSVFEGLKFEKNLHPAEYMNYVHNIDISPLQPCNELNKTIKDMAGRKLIFTNGPKHFATVILKQLEMLDMFESIYAIEDSSYIPKPHIDAYSKFITTHNTNTKSSCFFEDSIENLEPAHKLGITTIYLDKSNEMNSCAKPYFIDYCTNNLNNFLSSNHPHFFI